MVFYLFLCVVVDFLGVLGYNIDIKNEGWLFEDMLKFLQNRDEVVDMAHTLAEMPVLSPFKVCVAGSYVTGLNKKASSIDIVLKLRDGMDRDLIGSVSVVESIHRATVDVYSNKIQVIWLDLLEKDEENLLDFQRKYGMEANPESAYTNIVEQVRWTDESDEEISDEEELLEVEDREETEDEKLMALIKELNGDDEEDSVEESNSEVEGEDE